MKKAILLSASIAASSLLFVYFYPSISPPSSGNGSAPHTCRNQRKADSSLTASANPTLRKLAEYEQVCQGSIVDELMTFAGMPRTPAEAIDSASHTATILQEFAAHNITPLVVFEPTITPSIRLTDIHHGIYDESIQLFFATLKQKGITDQQMGTWVLFPEANTPIWNTTDPHDFSENVKKVGMFQKNVFPDSKISILLNSRTYPNHDVAWEHGVLKSLGPYIVNLPPGLVDRFGYQGFPSISEADAPQQYKLTNGRDFLPAKIASDAAKELGVKDIWVNTGTFSRIYTDDPQSEVRMSANERREILAGVLDQVALLRPTSTNLSINLFAEDKSLMREHTDWSYWHKDTIGKGDDTDVFMWFVHQLRSKEINFSLYDSL